jgi:opacity protein-like surface antigen
VATHVGTGTVQNPFCPSSCGDTRLGWTIGGGLEYAITNNWTVKAEGLYLNFDSATRLAGGNIPYAVMSGVGVAGGPATDRVLYQAPASAFSPRASGGDEHHFIARIGVNFKFSMM